MVANAALGNSIDDERKDGQFLFPNSVACFYLRVGLRLLLRICLSVFNWIIGTRRPTEVLIPTGGAGQSLGGFGKWFRVGIEKLSGLRNWG